MQIEMAHNLTKSECIRLCTVPIGITINKIEFNLTARIQIVRPLAPATDDNTNGTFRGCHQSLSNEFE